MRIHLIRKETIQEYVSRNAQSKYLFDEWLRRIRSADWNSPADIFNTFPSADILGKGSSRIILDIGGNNYRMICKYVFGNVRVRLYVLWIGTHAEYDKLCKRELQYLISNY